MKKWILFMVMLVMAAVLAACGSDSVKSKSDKTGTNGGGEVKELRFAHPYNENHPLHLAAQKFADTVEKESNGSIKIKMYPNGSLGGATDLLEGLQMNTVDMSLVATAIASTKYKPLDLFYLPFLFNDREHAYKVADGEVGQALYQGYLDKTGIKTLGMFESGFRTITNSKHIVRTPDDLKGLKIRVADAPVSIDTFNALGVNGSPIPLNELFTALQQGTVDGQDNPLGNVYTMKLYEVQPYITLSQHQWAGIMFVINNKVFEGFTDEEKKIVLDAAKEAEEWQRQEMQKAEQEYMKAIKEAGVEITELKPDEKEAFRKAMEPIWKKYEGEIGKELIQKAVDAGAE